MSNILTSTSVRTTAARPSLPTFSPSKRHTLTRHSKSFPAVAGLRAHLLSAKHAGLIKVQCPRCCKWFDTMAALTAHAESQSVRCNLRETDGYRQFLDQVTAGMLDTTDRHDDGTKKYAVPDEARQRFETSQGKWVREQQFKD